MRHQNRVKKLGRKASHRRALLRNLVTSLFKHDEIKTTLAKAKVARRFAEKMITLGKRGDLHARRTALKFITEKDVVKRLFEEVAPRFSERNGGYTRVLKLGPRKGDGAEMAIIQLVESEATVAGEKPRVKMVKPIPTLTETEPKSEIEGAVANAANIVEDESPAEDAKVADGNTDVVLDEQVEADDDSTEAANSMEQVSDTEDQAPENDNLSKEK